MPKKLPKGDEGREGLLPAASVQPAAGSPGNGGACRDGLTRDTLFFLQKISRGRKFIFSTSFSKKSREKCF